MTHRSVIIITILLAICRVGLQVDICEILDANYCFYFSDSSCYINLCKCEACSTNDKISSLLHSADDDPTSNSTDLRHEKLCPTWCPHIKSNETIINILGQSNSTTATEEISFECDDLEQNCLANRGYNGHCYFFEKNCGFKAEIAVRGKAKNDQSRFKKCLKFQRKCHNKYPKHYACRQLKKRCRGVKLPEITDFGNNSTIVGSVGNNSTVLSKTSSNPLEQCINYQKICAAKYSKHFACRQFNKKCKEYSLPPVSPTDVPVSKLVSGAHHGKKHHKFHNHHHRKHLDNRTTTHGNDTLID